MSVDTERTFSNRRSQHDRDIDEILAARLKAAHARLVADGSSPDPSISQDILTLFVLKTLMGGKRRAAPGGRRAISFVLATVALIIVSLLVFVRMPAVDVDMQLQASALAFETLTPVTASGVTALKLLQANAFGPSLLEDPRTGSFVEVLPPIDIRPAGTGSITLSSLIIPPNAHVRIQKASDAGTWRLDITHPSAAVTITLAGRVDLSFSRQRLQRQFGRGTALPLRAGGDESPHLDLHVVPRDPSAFLTDRILGVRGVTFDETLDDPETLGIGLVHATRSSIEKGTIINHSLGGRETVLRGHEIVRLTGTAEIWQLQLGANEMRIALTANAQELQIGSAKTLRTLRPSLLEWTAEHHSMKLLWGSVVWLFAILVGGVRWWGSSDEP